MPKPKKSESQAERKENAVKQLQIRMTTDDIAEVLLYDMIGVDPWFGDGISAKTFREQIKGLKAKTLNLRVNSPGGDVFEASAMLTALDEFKGVVNVDVDGLAASAASYLIMGADTIRLGTNAMMMIHDPYGGVMGSASDMRGMADVLDKAKGQILDAYGRKSKAGREQLAAWMSAETWFTGQEAVDAGLADAVTEPVRVAALAQHSPILAKLKYKHVPPLPQDNAAWEATRKRMEIAAKL
jgi:ATP-dependent Clp protease, protease subunit